MTTASSPGDGTARVKGSNLAGPARRHANEASDGPVVGFIGLGDQGLPMARGVADADFTLHVWARRTASLEALRGAHFIVAASPAELAAVCDVVAVCVSTDEDVLALADQMTPAMRPGTIFVNHGTGTPRIARHLAELLAARDIDVLDAPVSGGRPAADEKRLTLLVGGTVEALRRAEPVFRTFARHVLHLGEAGAGQTAKLLNNALLTMNQAAVADILELGTQAGLELVSLVEALKLGSASSTALHLLNTMITADTVGHLVKVQEVDMAIFGRAMREACVDPVAVDAATERGLSGTRRLGDVVAQLTAEQVD